MKLTIIRGVTPSQQGIIDSYLAWMRAWSAAPATLKVRGIVARGLLARYGNPEDITTDQITEWLASPAFSPATRSVYCSHANTFFGWLLETDRITRNPMTPIRRPRQPKGRPRPLSTGEVSRALEAATPEMRAWALLGIYAGLRAHEVAKIRGEDVTMHELVVRGKGGKLALLPTHPAVWALAQEYPRTGFWFPSTRTESGHVPSGRVSSATTRLLSGLGIVGSHHRFRHTYGTNLLRSGANIRVVQELLRHNSLATTEVYTFVADDERRDAISRLIA